MSDLETFISKEISLLIPSFENIDFRAQIGDSSYSVEFFVTINGKKMQCYDMVDKGLIKESKLDSVSENIAKFIRRMPSYKKGTINKIKLTISK